MTPIRRRLFGTLATLASVAALASFAPAASAQAYPNTPVRIIVGFAAGTGPDIVARQLAQELSKAWGGAGVIVDNKPGAGGLIAAQEAARAQPDGYTLMLGETGQLSIAPSSYSKLPYDPVKDFAPVSHVVSSELALLINPQKVPARNVKDFVEWTKTQKGLFMATFGAGTPGHFGAYMFGEAVKVKPAVVHSKTPADALGGLFGGDVSAVFASIGLSTPNVRGGKLFALGSTGATRTSSLPEVPTLKEQGYASLEFASWFGIVAPARTPVEILNKLNADIVKAVSAPEAKAKLEELGFRVTGTSRDQFARIIAADTVTWGKAVAASGFKAD